MIVYNRAYKRRLRDMPEVDKEKYQQQKEQTKDFYREADNMDYGSSATLQASEEAKKRMVAEVHSWTCLSFGEDSC